MRLGANIREVESLQPDMMGFICWEGSRRNVADTPDYLPKVTRVGVFVNPTMKHLLERTQALGLNRIQLHGSESASFCQTAHDTTGLPVTKTISVRTVEDIDRWREYEAVEAVDLLLFDTQCRTVGGSGEQFDWDILHHYEGGKPFLLAGGIGPGDEERVLSFRHPRLAGIDLNSRFETSPAIKDVDKLRTFINTIRHESNK